jgi:cyclic pyranopterin phosphate synthase
MPADGIKLLSHEEILTYEEIEAIAKAAAELGVNKLRLTGGEPLVRSNITELVVKLAKIDTIKDFSLTTNGILLKHYAAELKRSGLHRVNISLDSLNPEKFKNITRNNKLEDVLQGIEAAKAAGLNPVKINVVAMRGVNDDEILDFAKKTITEGWHVRFIELMPFGNDSLSECHLDTNDKPKHRFISVDEITEIISHLGKLQPSTSITGNGPAKYFHLPEATGTIGFISPVSHHFCFNCNRLRLTADGKLRPCLLSEKEIDLREALRSDSSHEKLSQAITETIRMKPKQHNLSNGASPGKRFMSQVGG